MTAIDLYVFGERNVFDSDARWLDALAEVAALDVPGLALQVRTKTEAPERALALARQARAVTLDARCPVLLNGSTVEARELGYGGVHWPEGVIPVQAASGVPRHSTSSGRTALGRAADRYEEVPSGPSALRSEHVEPENQRTGEPGNQGSSGRTGLESKGLLIGASVHSVEACRRAEAAGADFVVAGTIFDAGSKPVAGEGLVKLRGIVEGTRLPVLAIGGVTPERVAPCIEAGATGVAVVTGVLRAPDMAAAVRELREALDEAAGRDDLKVAATSRRATTRRSGGG